MRIASLARAPLEIVHERIDAGAAHIGIALSIPLRVEQAALDSQRIVAASGDALPHPSAHASRSKVRCWRAFLNRRSSVVNRHEWDADEGAVPESLLNRRSGAVNRHEWDVRMTCNSRSRAAVRRVLSSSRTCSADNALASFACAARSTSSVLRAALRPSDSSTLERRCDRSLLDMSASFSSTACL